MISLPDHPFRKNEAHQCCQIERCLWPYRLCFSRMDSLVMSNSLSLVKPMRYICDRPMWPVSFALEENFPSPQKPKDTILASLSKGKVDEFYSWVCLVPGCRCLLFLCKTFRSCLTKKCIKNHVHQLAVAYKRLL